MDAIESCMTVFLVAALTYTFLTQPSTQVVHKQAELFAEAEGCKIYNITDSNVYFAKCEEKK